jgi:sulfatase maturation enzyme AslB (radical SAM superfamily)
MEFERISIELANRCQKGCWFCYNRSHAGGDEVWTLDELARFILDCCDHGTKAVSLGGGEPLQSPLLLPLLKSLQGRLFRSFTTNGLLLDEPTLDAVADAHPDKVHVSIHFPENPREVARVIEQVHSLATRGITSGVNLLVARSHLAPAAEAAKMLRCAGIGNDRIVYLPMRGQDTPTPGEVAQVAGGERFQSMTCLAACGKSQRFCSIGWDRQAAWCSYTASRRPIEALTHTGLVAAMSDLPLTFCGAADVN